MAQRRRTVPGWDVRVVPNKFPALQVEGDARSAGRGAVRQDERRRRARSDHRDARSTTSRWRRCRRSPSSAMLWAYRERVLDLRRTRASATSSMFKNHGVAAGASLEHPHSQLIALPVVPRNVRDEIAGAKRALRAQGAVRLLRHHPAGAGSAGARDSENAEFLAVSPYAPRFPFETWMLPKRHGAVVRGRRRGTSTRALARMLKETLQRMNRALESPPFNLIIHSAPFSEDTAEYVPLAHRDHAEADEGGGVRVGDAGSISIPRRPKRRLRCCARLSRVTLASAEAAGCRLQAAGVPVD